MDAVHIVHSCWWLVDNVTFIERGVFVTKNGFKDKKESNKHNVSILCISSQVKVLLGCGFCYSLCILFLFCETNLKSAIKKYCGCNWLMCFVFGVIEKIN